MRQNFVDEERRMGIWESGLGCPNAQGLIVCSYPKSFGLMTLEILKISNVRFDRVMVCRIVRSCSLLEFSDHCPVISMFNLK